MKKSHALSFVVVALALGAAQLVSIDRDAGDPSTSLRLGPSQADARRWRLRVPRLRAPAFLRRAAAFVQRTTANVVRSGGNFVRRAGGAITQGLQNAGNTLKKGVGQVIDKGKKLASNVTKGIGQAFDKVKQGGKWLADKAKDGAKWVGDKAKQGLNWIKEQAEKLKKLLAQVGELGKKLASFATGEIGKLIKAFKGGLKGLLKYAADKLPGPAGKIIDAAFLQGGSLMDRLKRVGQLLLGDLKKLIDGVKNGMKNGIDKVVKPLVAKARDFILNTVMKPAISALGGLLNNEIDKVVERVAANILGRTENLRGQIDKLGGIIDAVANGEQGVNDKLASFGTSIDTIGQDIVNFALDYGLGWLRGKAVTFVMKNVDKFMQKVWSWAYKGVSIARNAVQGAVGSIPFVGGALAVVLGVLIDEGWNLLKGKVDEFIETAVNNLADSAMGAAKNMLSGLAGKAGGALQGLVDALKGPLQTISTKVRERVLPILEKYRAVVSRLQKLAKK